MVGPRFLLPPRGRLKVDAKRETIHHKVTVVGESSQPRSDRLQEFLDSKLKSTSTSSPYYGGLESLETLETRQNL